MDGLAGELVVEVGSYLDAGVVCGTMSRVCKSWRNPLLSSAGLWRDFSDYAAKLHIGPFQIPRINGGLGNIGNIVGHSDDYILEVGPPWRVSGPTFARGIAPVEGYEMWSRYVRAEEEHQKLVIPVQELAKRVDERVLRYQNHDTVRLSHHVIPVALWILSIFQLLAVAASLEQEAFIDGWAAPSQIALGLVIMWWFLTAYPILTRTLAEWQLKSRTRQRYLPQDRFYQHVAPLGTRGALVWPKPIRLHRFPNEADLSKKMRWLEMTILVLTSFTLLAANVSNMWIVLSPAIAGFTYRAATSTYIHCRPQLRSRQRRRDVEIDPENLLAEGNRMGGGGKECPITRTTVGCVAAAILLVGVGASATVSPEINTVFPLLAPCLLASTLLWHRATDQCSCCFLCAAPISCGFFPCEFTFVITTILRLLGISTLWFTAIATMLRVENWLYPDNAHITWPNQLSWYTIFAPTALNFLTIALKLVPF